MGKLALRVSTTAAVLCVSAFLLACVSGQLHMQIPDFFTSGVQGVQLYRVDDATGQLVDAGRIEFLGIETSQDGEVMKYRQVTADGQPWFGPVYTPVIRNASMPDGIEVTVTFLNQLPSGWFKVASYNLYGTSLASTNQTFVVGDAG